ncbi:uncharacterized protein LOC134215199 [Armigeres subalbatus]|uniref:uncharacterized protein LOC134215199 n=1 Tax=Armigeres subalbatus TaxID=124917 RepID=UPI002ED08E02
MLDDEGEDGHVMIIDTYVIRSKRQLLQPTAIVPNTSYLKKIADRCIGERSGSKALRPNHDVPSFSTLNSLITKPENLEGQAENDAPRIVFSLQSIPSSALISKTSAAHASNITKATRDDKRKSANVSPYNAR